MISENGFEMYRPYLTEHLNRSDNLQCWAHLVSCTSKRLAVLGGEQKNLADACKDIWPWKGEESKRCASVGRTGTLKKIQIWKLILLDLGYTNKILNEGIS